MNALIWNWIRFRGYWLVGRIGAWIFLFIRIGYFECKILEIRPSSKLCWIHVLILPLGRFIITNNWETLPCFGWSGTCSHKSRRIIVLRCGRNSVVENFFVASNVPASSVESLRDLFMWSRRFRSVSCMGVSCFGVILILEGRFAWSSACTRALSSPGRISPSFVLPLSSDAACSHVVLWHRC